MEISKVDFTYKNKTLPSKSLKVKPTIFTIKWGIFHYLGF